MIIVETNFIRVSQQCASHYFCFISHLKQLYISNIAIRDTSVINIGLGCVFILKKSWLGLRLLVISSVVIKQLYQKATK